MGIIDYCCVLADGDAFGSRPRSEQILFTCVYASLGFRVVKEEEAKKEMATAQEGVAAAHKEVEAERDRFKKVIQELKKKLDRYSLNT